MAKKVAYVVFRGLEPGVYNTWTETEKQVKGHSQAVYQGYTVAEGGRDAAERAYEDYVRSKQSESAVPGGQGDVDEKQDA